MQGLRVILDFPGPGRNGGRLVFGTPHRVIAAAAIGEVRPALRQAESLARGGAWVVGFVAYEAAAAFDAALITRAHEGPTPLLWFGVFDEPESAGPPRAANVPALDWYADTARPDYDSAIRRIRDAIAAGDVYQVNHTLRFRAPCDVAPAALYDALVVARQGVYHALIETPAWAIVSASPELFLEIGDGIITSRPMKGTLRRGRWAEEDLAAAARLAGSPKDRAENLMIVDLVRNDLGRVAHFGTVAVPAMFTVETFPTVHQLTSTITARLRDGLSLDDIFAAAFPCGSVTGAPKIAAMQHIAALEHSPRGAYCGAIGVLRPDGTSTFSVGIRTLVIDRLRRSAVYGAGGGITWDSVAADEYDEAVAKTAVLSEPLPDFELLETMRLEHGELCRLDLHLARLTASAHYWGFSEDVPRTAAAALERERADSPAGSWRVRLTASRDARINITRTPIDAPRGRPSAAAETLPGHPPVALAATAVDSRDRRLHHKTTARAVYEKCRAGRAELFDVLLHNERGCITEFTTGNVVCEIDRELFTPPREAGLLAGTFRHQLIDRGAITEREIRVDELARVTRLWLINSVREWVEVTWDRAPAQPID